MATYPIDQGGLGAKVRIVPNAGIQFVGMQTGDPRGYTDFPEDEFTITIEHPWIEETDRDAIIAFYIANRTLENLVESDEGDFVGYFMNRPQEVNKEGPYKLLVSQLKCVVSP